MRVCFIYWVGCAGGCSEDLEDFRLVEIIHWTGASIRIILSSRPSGSTEATGLFFPHHQHGTQRENAPKK